MTPNHRWVIIIIKHKQCTFFALCILRDKEREMSGFCWHQLLGIVLYGISNSLATFRAAVNAQVVEQNIEHQQTMCLWYEPKTAVSLVIRWQCTYVLQTAQTDLSSFTRISRLLIRQPNSLLLWLQHSLPLDGALHQPWCTSLSLFIILVVALPLFHRHFALQIDPYQWWCAVTMTV